MPKFNEWFFTMIFFSAILGIVVACILFFINRNRSLSPRLLSVYLLMFSLVTLQNSLSYTSFFLHFPHLWRFTAWASFGAPVVAYLYVRSVLQQNFKLKRSDWFFFGLVLFGVLTFSRFYLLPAGEKLEVVKAFMANKTLIGKEPEGLLPIGWGIAIRLIMGMGFLTAQYVMLAKMFQKLKTTAASDALRQNMSTIRWLFLFTTVITIFYLIIIVAHYLLIRFSIDLSSLIFFSFFFTILFISLYLLAKPSILYGLQGWLQSPQPYTNITPAAEPVLVDDKRPTLSLGQGQVYKSALETHVFQNQPYRKSGYKIKDLADELAIPSYQLSAFINQEYGKNFNELINDYRVDYITNLLKNDPDYYQFTLEALAREAGFNSRNSFFSAVKKKTGKTPSEFFSTRSLTSYSDNLG
ncbi:helix-turn-helix domain-containing protein [Flavihumibacter fluvii]|uniref:helix-turn-helix domain-containing protein n=1 Tax=Flavihumibacter fluvii TaxID=2838157 RepID=UPI001BDE2C04|nr:helix-turn-helix domain-containing protein [Flavihumibacter fluvii]ULQ52871.1 helix-turn-helix domain-containing protein [Flavihumibacter fluvii]